MIELETVQQIRQASVAERIRLIELILQSLKHDIHVEWTDERPPRKRFKVRPFSLGKAVEKESLYNRRISKWN